MTVNVIGMGNGGTKVGENVGKHEKCDFKNDGNLNLSSIALQTIYHFQNTK